jgi:hypothetical protein
LVILSLGPDDEHHAATDRTDRNEAILVIRMGIVEDLQVVGAGNEQRARLPKRDPVLLLVCILPSVQTALI